jgi:hypothetical protein
MSFEGRAGIAGQPEDRPSEGSTLHFPIAQEIEVSRG